MDLFSELNRRLTGLDQALYPEPAPSRNLFVVGAPRSGTTLLTQLICASSDVGYINNVAASWWEAPAAGVAYARKLVQERRFSGSSSYGRTEDPSEPHEFGAFWRARLGYESMDQPLDARPDWDALLRSMDRIGAAWDGRPVLYKVFQLAWHLAEFHALRPSTRWIWVERDLAANAQSILKLTESRNERWTSAVPARARAEFDDRGAVERAVAQVHYFNTWLEEQFGQLSPDAVVRVSLSDLSQDPAGQLRRVGEAVGLEPDEARLESFASRMAPSKRPDADFLRQVEAARAAMGS